MVVISALGLISMMVVEVVVIVYVGAVLWPGASMRIKTVFTKFGEMLIQVGATRQSRGAQSKTLHPVAATIAILIAFVISIGLILQLVGYERASQAVSPPTSQSPQLPSPIPDPSAPQGDAGRRS